MPSSATSPQVAPLRLGIWHLIVWMLLTGGVAGLSEAIMIREPGETEDPWWMTIRLIFAVGYGLALTGLVVVVGEIARGRRRELAPGHIMILLGAVGAIADGGMYYFLYYVIRNFWWPEPQPHYTFWLIHQTVGYGLIGIAWTLAIPSWGVPLRWKLGFSVLSLLMLSQSAINGWLLLQWLGNAPQVVDGYFPIKWLASFIVVCTVVVIAEIIADWRQGRRYDWLHWAGILLALALATNQWLRFVKEIFFPPL